MSSADCPTLKGDAMNSMTEALVTIVAGITGVALVATLVSKNANTAAIIQNVASGYGNSLAVAVSPVTGSSVSPSLTYANSGTFTG